MPENQQNYPTQTSPNAGLQAQSAVSHPPRSVQPADQTHPSSIAGGQSGGTTAWQHPATNDQDMDDEGQAIKDVISPAGGFPQMPQFMDRPEDNKPKHEDQTSHQPVHKPEPTPASQPTASAPSLMQIEDLVGIKKMALNELMPLIDKLDQVPEDRFKTIMMLIQASDNDGLIKKAFEAASKINDQAAKAQALLDIVNEINYFTQLSKKGN